jgi:hypothetical protein
MNYDAENFSRLFKASFAPELWEYLQRPETILAMEVASKLRKPAVEAIGDDMIRHFGTVVQQKRVKQMIGHMIRQVMESRGYVLDAQRIPTRFDKLFSSGSRYRREGQAEQRPARSGIGESKPGWAVWGTS